MFGIICIVCGVLLLLGCFLWELAEFRNFHGKMLVTCPETGKPAAVKVDTWRGILIALAGFRRVRLRACSGWPEREGCDQECLCQIEDNPEAHKAWTIAAKWYEGKQCAYCGAEIAPVRRLDRAPALLSSERKTREWNQIPTEHLPEALWASQPVCWNCHIAESFKQKYPDRVTYRPWKRSGPIGQCAVESRD